MNQIFKQNVLRAVRKQKQTFTESGFRHSRRVEGMIEHTEESSHGFKNLYVYVHSALAGKGHEIASILSWVDTRSLVHSARQLMIFGFDPKRLTASGPANIRHVRSISMWEENLNACLSSTESTKDHFIIPCLNNEDSQHTHFPKKGDLCMFFCKGRKIFVSDEEHQKCFRLIAKRSIWFFWGDEETPEIEAGTFIPDIFG